jgi:hypothetical protein
MPLSAHAWTVLCRACGDLVIGTVEDGRFVHDPTCPQPLSIDAGSMRCCQCGGRLTSGVRPVAVQEPEEEPPTSILRFARTALAEGDTRQRL